MFRIFSFSRITLICSLFFFIFIKVGAVSKVPESSTINIYSSLKFTFFWFDIENHKTYIKITKPGDYYIDRLTGKILGRDRASTSNLRVIDKREWNYVRKEKGGPKSKEGIKELHKNSFAVVFDENQIQKEIQFLADDTAKDGLEHQLYIVLDVNTGKVFAKRELSPNKIFKTRSIIETYEIGTRSAPRIAEGLMLLAEVHGHPKTINRGEINVKSASKVDKQAARHLRINIFVVDAFDTTQSINFPRAIHRVNKRGRLKKYVGQTTGINGINTFCFTNYFTHMLKRN